MNHIILSILLFILFYLFFKNNLKEKFWLGYNALWMPTRSTRLMSYDLRGDPYGYYIYPSYYRGWYAPYPFYIFNNTRYDIFGRYIIQKPKKINKKIIKKKENK
jgi:hypothetical protein